MTEDEAQAVQYEKAEVNIDEEHFVKDVMPVAIPKDFNGVKDKISMEDFTPIKKVGRGMFGQVLLVKHKEDNKLYALKSLRKTKIIQMLQVEHTMSERTYILAICRRILEKMEHPFIVTLRYAFQTKDKLHMVSAIPQTYSQVFDYIPGGDLFAHLSLDPNFSEARARFYAAEIYLALDHLHSRHIVYRDLKPENVLIDLEGHVKLTDFGLAKELQRQKRGTAPGRTATFCGTDEYLAPEIILRQGYGESVDWWALGILIYEMLTGNPPWEDENRKRLFERILTEHPDLSSPSLSESAQDLLQKMLAKKVGNRIPPADIRRHPFFACLNFDDLLAKRCPPPYKPELVSTA